MQYACMYLYVYEISQGTGLGTELKMIIKAVSNMEASEAAQHTADAGE